MTKAAMQTTITETTAEEVPAPPPEELRGWWIAELLTEQVGVEVTMADIDELVATEHLVVLRHYKRRPVYKTAAACATNRSPNANKVSPGSTTPAAEGN